MSNEMIVQQGNTDAGILYSVLNSVMKFPGVTINRDSYLRKELAAKHVGQDKIDLAINHGVLNSGIDKKILNDIANEAIRNQTLACTSMSVLSGIPGGLAMLGTVPADIAQYYFHILVVVQKLMYIYGMPSLEFNNNNISDDSMSLVIICLGIMSGVQAATTALHYFTEQLVKQVSKKIPRMAISRMVLYPIVKKIANILGFKMSKEIFAKGLGKIIPVAGGVISGTFTLCTFLPCCKKLKKKLSSEFYDANRDVNAIMKESNYIIMK